MKKLVYNILHTREIAAPWLPQIAGHVHIYPVQNSVYNIVYTPQRAAVQLVARATILRVRSRGFRHAAAINRRRAVESCKRRAAHPQSPPPPWNNGKEKNAAINNHSARGGLAFLHIYKRKNLPSIIITIMGHYKRDSMMRFSLQKFIAQWVLTLISRGGL